MLRLSSNHMSGSRLPMICGSLEEGHDQASIDKAWDDEPARRAKELDEGRAEIVELDHVKAQIAKRLGER